MSYQLDGDLEVQSSIISVGGVMRYVVELLRIPRASAGHPNQTATQTKSLLARSESHTWSERVPYSVNTALQLAIECMYACTTGSPAAALL